MHDQVTWQLIPSGVVSKILWSEDLQLSDKLRCQSVCKTWRWSLQEVPSDSLPNSSTYDLAVELLKGWAARSPTQWRNETPPRLMLWTRDTATTTSFSNLFPACHRWLTLKAPLLRRIHLTGHYPELGHFRDVFSILQAQSLRLPPILEVKLSSGLDFVAGCHDLLTNTLVELNLDSEANAVVQAGEVCMLLQALQCLHTLGLNCFRGTQVDLASLPAVHTLSLKQCAINVDDLSSHTQLTSLEINWDQRLDQALLLTGSTVQLQRLQISANEVAFQVIRNLQAATQLTHLTLASIADPQLHFEGLTALRELSLEFCNMTVCDLSSCTRLTEVQIYWGDVISQEVNLPAGSTVQLQRLCILARHNQHYFSVLRKLEDATQLTYIHLRNTCPLDIGEHGWPEFMPSLQVFKANQIPFAPPKQLTEYTNLRQVHLGCHFKGPPADCLPKWSSQLSNLTKLETLSISGGFKQWPSFVMHLRQLRCLDLSCNQLSQRWIVFRHLAIYNLQCPHIP